MAEIPIRACRICEDTDIKNTVLDMGHQPLVNSLIDWGDTDKPENTHHLLVVRCSKCGLVQTANPVDSDEIYRQQDYLYFSGDMPGLYEYFEEYANELMRHVNKDDFVVEIGSNDGTMLKQFMEHNRILGVDPAANTVVRALAEGIRTLSDAFGERIGLSILREFGKAKLIYGNNCIAHIDDLTGVMKGVVGLLDRDGVFAVECNYWGAMVENSNYSLVYHDHFSYFSLNDWETVAKKFGMSIFDAYVTPAQGGSLRVMMSKDNRLPTQRYSDLKQKEKDTNLNSHQTCEKYQVSAKKKAKQFGDKIRKAKKAGKIVAGYGAAAKGFSLISLAGVSDLFDFFVDDSDAKQGKFTPIYHVPVVARKDRPDPDVFVITAPNYEEQIRAKEKDFKGEFIVY